MELAMKIILLCTIIFAMARFIAVVAIAWLLLLLFFGYFQAWLA